MPFEEIEFKNRIQKETFQVRQIKIALNRLGYYRPEERKGITSEDDTVFYEAFLLSLGLSTPTIETQRG